MLASLASFLFLCIQNTAFVNAASLSSRFSGGQRRASKNSNATLIRRLDEAEGEMRTFPSGVVPDFTPLPAPYNNHKPNENAILAALFSDNVLTIRSFVGTARKYFSGDIVLAIYPGMSEAMLDLLRSYNAILYEIPIICRDYTGKIKSSGTMCKFDKTPEMDGIPIAQLRFYLYWLWARKYNPVSKLLIADTRDVMFQSDPFAYTHV